MRGSRIAKQIIEEQRREHPLVLGLGIEKQVPVTGLHGILPQSRQHPGRQILALVGRIHGNIFQKIALSGAGGSQGIFLIKQHGDLSVRFSVKPGFF